MLKRFLTNPAPWWAIILALALYVPVGAANASLFYGWVVLPAGTNAPPNSVDKIVNDGGTINGIAFNVPANSSNGFTFYQGGTLAAEIFANGGIFGVGPLQGNSLQTNSGQFVATAGGAVSSTSLSTGGITSAGISATNIVASSNITTSSYLQAGSCLGGVTFGDVSSCLATNEGRYWFGNAHSLDFGLNHAASYTFDSGVYANGVTSTGGMVSNGFASTSSNPAVSMPNGLSGASTWFGVNAGTTPCAGVTGSGFYISAVGNTNIMTGDGSGNVGVCGSWYGDGSHLTGITLPNVPTFASGSCTVAGGTNSCNASIDRNLGSGYSCSVTLSNSTAIGSPGLSIVSGTSVNVEFPSNLVTSTTAYLTCMTPV